MAFLAVVSVAAQKYSRSHHGTVRDPYIPPTPPPLPTPGYTPRSNITRTDIQQTDPSDIDLDWTSDDNSYEEEPSGSTNATHMHNKSLRNAANPTGTLERINLEHINAMTAGDAPGHLMNVYLPGSSQQGSPSSNTKKLKKLIPRQAFLFNNAVQPELKKILIQRNLSDQSVIHV